VAQEYEDDAQALDGIYPVDIFVSHVDDFLRYLCEYFGLDAKVRTHEGIRQVRRQVFDFAAWPVRNDFLGCRSIQGIRLCYYWLSGKEGRCYCQES
jgi:hypothetical protein